MKVIISGGGTGGHIYPALSIADALKRKYKGTQILYIGTNNGLESSLVPKHGYRFEAIRVKGFQRRLSIDTLRSAVELFKGLYDAERLVRRYRPDIVVGTGGYVAGPVLMAAHLKGIPILIHEQNVLPGATNRILGRFAGAIAVSFEEAVQYFRKKDRVFVTGNPIRQEIMGGSRVAAVKEFGFSPELPMVLCFGGSKGSASLNRAMTGFIGRMSGGDGFQLLHATGEYHYRAFMEGLREKGISTEGKKNIKIVPYIHRMPQALSAADLVITSAGAITIAEITAIGLPAVLVPKSYVAGNHQEYNARALEKRGAAVVLPENRLDGDVLYEKVSGLIRDKEGLLVMRRAGKEMGKTDAAERICDIIVKMVNR